MSSIVYLTSGLAGVLNSAFEIARRLEAEGHDVHFVGWRDVGAAVVENGHRYTWVDVDEKIANDLRTRVAAVGMLRSLPAAIEGRRRLISSQAFADAIRGCAPELIICDIEMHAALLATRRLGIPTLVRSEWFSLYRQRGVPPLRSQLGPASDVRSHLRTASSWALLLGQRALHNSFGQLAPRKLVRRFAPFRFQTISRHDLRQIARANGVKLGDVTAWTHWLRPHVYPSTPSISTTLEELDFGTGMPSGHHYVGPMVHHGRREINATESHRQAMDRFMTDERAAGRSILYCSVGTMSTVTLEMVERVIEVVRRRSDLAVVVGLGGTSPSAGDVHPRVHVMQYAPQLAALAAVDAAVIHGGVNTINECVAMGVPMVVHSGGAVDQPGCAARVEHHGVGVRVDLLTAESTDVEAQIDRVLFEDGFGERVAALRQQADDAACERRLERIVEAMLSGGSA